MTQKTWDRYFVTLAEQVSLKSKDRSTKVGAIIVGSDHEIRSTGYNGFPRGINDDVDSRHDRPAKYQYTEHAERNAIYNAARMGTSLKGCTLYLNYEPKPCVDCVRAIIQSGIIMVVGNDTPFGSYWKESMTIGENMLKEAGISIFMVRN